MGAIYLLKSRHKIWNRYFVTFLEALQFEVVMRPLRTFNMDLHPLTRIYTNQHMSN